MHNYANFQFIFSPTPQSLRTANAVLLQLKANHATQVKIIICWSISNINAPRRPCISSRGIIHTICKSNGEFLFGKMSPHLLLVRASTVNLVNIPIRPPFATLSPSRVVDCPHSTAVAPHPSCVACLGHQVQMWLKPTEDKSGPMHGQLAALCNK